MRYQLQKWWEIQQKLCLRLNRSQKIYLIALYTLPISTLLWLFQSNDDSIWAFSFSIGALFMGVLSDVAYLFNYLKKYKLAKKLTIYGYAFISFFLLSFSYQIVNHLAEFDVGLLTNTVIFTSFVLLPLLIFLVIIVLLTIGLLLAEIYFFISLTSTKRFKRTSNTLFKIKSERYPKHTFFGRIVAYSLIILITFMLGAFAKEPYEKLLSKSVAWYMYQFEAVKYSRCQFPEGKEGKAILLDNNEILFIEKKSDGYWFQPMKCVEKLK